MQRGCARVGEPVAKAWARVCTWGGGRVGVQCRQAGGQRLAAVRVCGVRTLALRVHVRGATAACTVILHALAASRPVATAQPPIAQSHVVATRERDWARNVTNIL